MTTDAAILLLLADLRADVQALREENQRLTALVAELQQEPANNAT